MQKGGGGQEQSRDAAAAAAAGVGERGAGAEEQEKEKVRVAGLVLDRKVLMKMDRKNPRVPLFAPLEERRERARQELAMVIFVVVCCFCGSLCLWVSHFRTGLQSPEKRTLRSWVYDDQSGEMSEYMKKTLVHLLLPSLLWLLLLHPCACG